MELENYFKNGKVYVWKETFAIIKSKKQYSNAFANVVDKKVMDEVTLIVDQSKLNRINKEDIVEIEKGWKILTFDMVLPFGSVGFLAKISKALADENISIFVISGYSTDHILIKEKNLEKAKKKFKNLGFTIEEK